MPQSLVGKQTPALTEIGVTAVGDLDWHCTQSL